MTKKEYLTNALKNGGMKGRIYQSVKELKHAQGTQYGAVLRGKDVPVRSASKKYFEDQEGVKKLRRRLYECETLYNVVIADVTEEAAERILEAFWVNLDKGYFEDGNWVEVIPEETDWVDEEDSVMKSKVAVQAAVRFRYGIYRDELAAQLPPDTEVKM